MTTPRPRYSAQEVAKAFVTKYYMILNKSPEIAHKFYQESSLLGWPRLNGDIKTVTTLSGINGEIMSSDYKYCLFETETVEFQESLEGGILIAVAGLLTLKDDVIKGFSQTFFLAKQEDGFFVLNDILQVVDISGFFTNTAIQDNQKKDQVAPTQNSGFMLSVPCGKSDHPASPQTKEADENAKKPSDSSVSKDTDAKVAATNSSEVALSQTKEAVENGNAKKTSDSSVYKDTYANVAATNTSEVVSSHTKELVENGNAKITSPETHHNLVRALDSSVSKDTNAKVAATNSFEVGLSQTKEAVDDGNAKKTSDSSVYKDTYANVAATNTSEVVSSHTKELVENGNAKITSPETHHNLVRALDSSVSKDTNAKVAATNSFEVGLSRTKEAVDDGNAKKTSDSSVSKDTYAKVAAANSSEVASSHTKEVVKDGKAKKTSNSSVSKDTDAKVAATNSSEVTASCEKAFPVLSPVSDVKKEASPKITYASVVAKASPPASPRNTSIHSNFDKKAAAPPSSKASASLVNGASNVSNPSSTESKPSAPSNAAEPNMQPAKRIYIGGLPYDITKQRVLEVLKQFGPVRRNSDSIQIRRHEDGFCCGFVEFESVDSARRAIEARSVKFGIKESYMAYRRSSSDRGNNEKGKGSSPPRNNGLNARRRIMAQMENARTRNSTKPNDVTKAYPNR
ncbi:uncharacterized protein [Primulina eburnea]|uniref:uncharacterized protein n=1 Tax=Primulina eburnea TaxID=1245227 RepID=UPI003C6C8FA5